MDCESSALDTVKWARRQELVLLSLIEHGWASVPTRWALKVRADGMQPLATSAEVLERVVLEQEVYHCYLRRIALEQGPCSVEKTEKDHAVAPKWLAPP
jgi:hypothetical protein